MAAAFVLGEVCAAGYIGTFIFLGLLFAAALFVEIYFLAGFDKKEYRRRLCADIILCFLFFLSGGCRFLEEEDKRAYQEFVEEEATQIRGRVDGIKETEYGYTLMLSQVEIKGGKKKGLRLVVYVQDLAGILPGDTVQAKGTLRDFDRAGNPGEFDSYLYYRSLGCHYSYSAEQICIVGRERIPVRRTLMTVRERFREVYRRICTEEAAGIYQAMLLGEKGELLTETKDLYSDGGISHILAISGLHIAVLGMGLYHFLRKFGGFGFSGMIAGGMISLYVMMTGSAVSACRAGIMFLFQLLSFVIGRSYDMLSAASAALLILLWQNPWYLFYSGCQLSFGAVFAIGLVYPVVLALFEAENAVLKALLSSVSVSLVTFPVLSWSYFEISPYSVALNLAVIPCMTMVMLSGLLGGAAGLVSPLAGRFFIALGQYILFFYEMLCKLCAKLPGNPILTGKPNITIICIYYFLLLGGLLLFWVVCRTEKRLKKLLFAVFLFLLPFLLGVRVQRDFYVCFLNVSQGDGIYMETPDGVRILVDGGSSDKKNLYTRSILPFLKSRKVKMLDFAVVTHPDEDHISALKEMMKEGEIRIRQLLLPEISDSMKDEAYRSLVMLAEQKGIEVGYLSLGDAMRAGALTVVCLHPYEGLRTEDRNGYSTVLDISYGDFSMLLTGDLGEEGERFLATHIFSSQKSYTVLKVAHHGSKYSTCGEFLARVRAEYAVISCGKKNRYGHPHEEVLDRLSKAGISIWMTPERGAAQWEGGKIIDIP